MTASDYPITLPYGSTESPYGTSDFPYHRGDDYGAPSGTPVQVGDTVIGLSGATGMASGPCVHVQEWYSPNWRQDRKPTLMWQPGTVIATSDTSASATWGKYVTIQVTDWNVTYAHLSQINVTVGTLIKATNMDTITILQSALNAARTNAATFESALNAERIKTAALQKQIDDLTTKLTAATTPPGLTDAQKAAIQTAVTSLSGIIGS